MSAPKLLRPSLALFTSLAFGLVGCSPAAPPPVAAAPTEAPAAAPSPEASPAATIPNVLRFQGFADLGKKPMQGATLKAFDLASGQELSIIAGGAGNIIAGGAGNIIAGGAGNIIAGGAGNIIAGGAGNVIAGGAGNVIAGGAGNHRVLSQSTPQADALASGDLAASDTFASGPPTTDLKGAFDCAIIGLKPNQAVKFVASANGASLVSLLGGGGFSLGGIIIAGGAGNIIAGGAGNIIAGGAGNIIAGGAGNVITGGAGNIIAGGAGNYRTQRGLLQEGGASAPASASLNLTLGIKMNPATTVASKAFEGVMKVQYQLPEELVALGLERALEVATQALTRLETEFSTNTELAEEMTALLNENGQLTDPNAFADRLAESGLQARLSELVQESLTQFIADQAAGVGPARREELPTLSQSDFPLGGVSLQASGSLTFVNADGETVLANIAPESVLGNPEDPPTQVEVGQGDENDGSDPIDDGSAQGGVTIRDGQLRNPTASEGLAP